MGILINNISRLKSKTNIKNLEYHNKQKGKATGNRDDDYKKYNFDALQLSGQKPIENYNKYIEEHSHIGYNSYKDELKEDDFIMARSGDSIRKLESICVAPPIKILLSEIDEYDYGIIQDLFDDYLDFMKNDEKLKNVKILSANAHLNEIYYPTFERNENGKLRKLSEVERKERAYIKPHLHIDYIPLIAEEKDGKKYLKLSSKEIWKADSDDKYFSTYSKFNDRCYEKIGKKYGFERGEKWEEWDERIQKKNNGEKIKEQRKLFDFQMENDENEYNEWKEQLIDEIKKYDKDLQEAEKQYEKEIQKISEESNRMLQNQKQKLDKDLYNQIEEYEKKRRIVASKQENIDNISEETQFILDLEETVKNHKMEAKEAAKRLKDAGLDDILKSYRDEVKKGSPMEKIIQELYNMER